MRRWSSQPGDGGNGSAGQGMIRHRVGKPRGAGPIGVRGLPGGLSTGTRVSDSGLFLLEGFFHVAVSLACERVASVLAANRCCRETGPEAGPPQKQPAVIGRGSA